MKIFYCEVCNARLSPEDLPLGAEPYDETKTVHYCEKHKPVLSKPVGKTSNPGMRALGSNPGLKAVGSNPSLKALPKSSSNPNLRTVTPGGNAQIRRTPAGNPQIRRTPGGGGPAGSGIRSGPKGSGIRPNIPGSGIRPGPTGSGIRATPTGSGIRSQPPGVAGHGAAASTPLKRARREARGWDRGVLLWAVAMLALMIAGALVLAPKKARAPQPRTTPETPPAAPESPEKTQAIPEPPPK